MKIASEQVYSTLTPKISQSQYNFLQKEIQYKKHLTTFSKHKIKKSPTPKCGGLELVA